MLPAARAHEPEPRDVGLPPGVVQQVRHCFRLAGPLVPQVRVEPAVVRRRRAPRREFHRSALAFFSLLAFTSLGLLHQRLLTQLLGSRRFRCGQRPGRWSAPEAETLEKGTQAFHASGA